MIIEELRQMPEIIMWLDNLNGSKQTVKSYLQSMQAYTEFTKLSPCELIEEAEKELGNRHRKLKMYLIGFRKSQAEKGLSELSVRTRLAGVKSFYESFEIPLPKLQSDRRRACTLEDNDAIPSKEDLQNCLKVCDLLEKAVMLTGVSSGLASQEVRDLKLKEFKEGYDTVTGVTTLHITRQKTKTRFYTFLSVEATQAINDYLAFRDREVKAAGAKRALQVQKQRTTEDSYLFILKSVPDEYLTTGNEELRQMTDNAITKLYRSISDKARLNTKAGSYNVIRSHTMRKYFNSAMLNAGADSFFTEFIIGHTLDGTRAAYFKASPEKLREIYLKFMPYLTIERILDVSVSPEYQKIKADNEVLQIEAYKGNEYKEELIRRNEEVKALRAAYEVMAKKVFGEEEITRQKEEADKTFKAENKDLLKKLGMWKD